jgi:hypothetical protein
MDMVRPISRNRPTLRRTALLLTTLAVGVLPVLGCAPMTQQQKDATELRRFCERNPQASTTCLGFHGRA